MLNAVADFMRNALDAIADFIEREGGAVLLLMALLITAKAMGYAEDIQLGILAAILMALKAKTKIVQ